MSYVTVDVDIDDVMRQVDTDDLVEEMKRRNREPEGRADVSVQQIFEAFYCGNESAAIALTKSYVQAVTGRVLP